MVYLHTSLRFIASRRCLPGPGPGWGQGNRRDFHL